MEAPYQKTLKEEIKKSMPSGYTMPQLIAKTVAAAKYKTCSINFLKRAYHKSFGIFWNNLENNYTKGRKQYLKDVMSAYNQLINYKASNKTQETTNHITPIKSQEASESGVKFLKNFPPLARTDGKLHARIKCYSCNTCGHYTSNCPSSVE